MSFRIVSLMILMLMFSLSLPLPKTCANMQESLVQISCFTQNSLSLDYLGLSIIVYENNSMFLVGSTQFEAIGNEPILRFTINCSGLFPLPPIGIVTSDVAFFIANGSRDYYVGSYWEKFYVNASENDGADFHLDLTSNVETAKNVLSSEGKIEDFGIRGRMTFELIIDDSVGIIRQKRFVRVLLQANADLYVITCGIIVPQTADFIEAKKDDQEMNKIFPYWVDTSVGVIPMEPSAANLYLEWEMPEEVPWPIMYPYNYIIAIIISLLVGWIGRYTYDKMISAGNSQNDNKEKDMVKRVARPVLAVAKRVSPLLIVGILTTIVAYLLYIYTDYLQVVSALTTLGPEWTLALLNGIITTVLVIITALQMLEARRARLESVKPSFSLQPADYTLGGGFLSLHLVNGGGVARNVEIDVSHKGNQTLLYNSSIGTGERTPILRGSFPSQGEVVKIQVKYRDSYGLKHKEDLSLDFDSLKTASREITYILSPIDMIAHRLRDIESELRDISNNLRR